MSETTESGISETATYRLKRPIQFGEQLIEQLELKANGKAMQGFKANITMGDESFSVDFEPYRFAELGLRLAGMQRALVDRMHPADQTGLGTVAMGFIFGGPAIGQTP